MANTNEKQRLTDAVAELLKTVGFGGMAEELKEGRYTEEQTLQTAIKSGFCNANEKELLKKALTAVQGAN